MEGRRYNRGEEIRQVDSGGEGLTSSSDCPLTVHMRAPPDNSTRTPLSSAQSTPLHVTAPVESEESHGAVWTVGVLVLALALTVSDRTARSQAELDVQLPFLHVRSLDPFRARPRPLVGSVEPTKTHDTGQWSLQ